MPSPCFADRRRPGPSPRCCRAIAIDGLVGPWLQHDDHRLAGSERGARIREGAAPEIKEGAPEAGSLLALGCTRHDASGAGRELDGGLGIGLQVEPPGGLRVGPAVHRRRDQVGAVLDEADDRDPLLAPSGARPCAAGASPTGPAFAGPKPKPPTGRPIQRSMRGPDGPHQPARDLRRGLGGRRRSTVGASSCLQL